MLADSAKEKPVVGEVIKAGPGKEDDEMKLSAGDKVVYFKYAGDKMMASVRRLPWNRAVPFSPLLFSCRKSGRLFLQPLSRSVLARAGRGRQGVRRASPERYPRQALGQAPEAAEGRTCGGRTGAAMKATASWYAEEGQLRQGCGSLLPMLNDVDAAGREPSATHQPAPAY